MPTTLHRGWITWTAKTTATPATSRDVAPPPAPVDDVVALPELRDGQDYVVDGSSVFHDRRCTKVEAAFAAGKSIRAIAADDAAAGRTLCATCRKVGTAAAD